MATQPSEARDAGEAPPGPEALAEADLRVLLDEAEAARTELTLRTEELGRRLATLETLVVGVTEALEELRSAHDPDRETTSPSTPRRTRSRAGARSRPRAA